ncbi:MAG: hypothetical protein Q9191_001172 [Dirinaria sp. TL-2023a]
MLARLSLRTLTITTFFLILLSFVTFFRGSSPSYNIHTKIPKTAGLWHSTKGPSKPSPEIKKFWVKWSRIFYDSRPTVEPIVVKTTASTDGSDKANGERQPSSHTLSLPDQVVNSLHDSHKALLQDRGGLYGSRFDNASSQGLFKGAGVVTVAGGPYFAPAIVSIRMLRLVSDLPVHVFVGDHSEYEPELCENVLPALNAECFAISDFLAQDSVDVTRYQLKALAILFSPFETVMYLDSDCFAVRDPSELFETEPFKSTGLVTWPDYWIATEDPVFYKIAGMNAFPPGMPARSTESGELLISKNMHLSSLLLACYYNVYGPQYYYPILSQGASGEGDKETFMAAAVVLGLPYYRVKEHVGTLGYFTHEGDFKGGAMVQHHPGDDVTVHNGTWATEQDSNQLRPFFIHAHHPKLNVGRLVDESTLTSPTGKALRLWGPKESMEKKFDGRDVEKEVWKQMKDMTCELEDRMGDWRGRHNLCLRAKEHYAEVFGEQAFLSGII